MDAIECASRYDEYCAFYEGVSLIAISCTPYVNKFEDGRAVLDNRAITTLQQCFLSDIIRTILAKVRSMTDQISSGVINSWSCFSHVFSGIRAALPRETIELLENQGFHFTTMDIPLREYTAAQLQLVRIFLSIHHYRGFGLDKSLFAGWEPPIEEDLFGSVLPKEVMETDTLYWDRQNGKIYTDCYVKMYSPDGFIQGYGMESDERARNTIILKVFDNFAVVKQDSTATDIDSVNFIGPILKK